MREIKFRAWFIEDKEMDECTRIDLPNKTHNDDVIAMQYIGVIDDKGEEIYEGDILSVTYDGGVETIHEVFFDGCEYPAFDLKPHLGGDMNSFSDIVCSGCYTMVVIGNVHENPELLGGQ
jgi:hypothetical protein